MKKDQSHYWTKFKNYFLIPVFRLRAIFVALGIASIFIFSDQGQVIVSEMVSGEAPGGGINFIPLIFIATWIAATIFYTEHILRNDLKIGKLHFWILAGFVWFIAIAIPIGGIYTTVVNESDTRQYAVSFLLMIPVVVFVIRWVFGKIFDGPSRVKTKKPWQKIKLWFWNFLPKSDIWRVFLISIAIYGAITIAVIGQSNDFMSYFRSPTIVFLFITLFMGIVTPLLSFGDRHKLPVGTILIAWLFLGSANSSTNPINLMDEKGQAKNIQNRLPSETKLVNYVNRFTSESPIVVIATAGGGIRAAAWTTAILSKLEDKSPGFHKTVFGISSVSGGTLGAVTWMVTVVNKQNNSKGPLANNFRGLHADLTKKFIANDFFSYAAAGMLFSELPKKLLFGLVSFPDRGKTLAAGWNNAYCNAVGITDCLTTNGWPIANFAKTPWSIWGGENNLNLYPAIFANGTDATTGKRVITSPIQTKGFTQDSFDFFQQTKNSISNGDLVLNSARFTFISPVGFLKSDLGNQYNLNIVDGGYFENFGAETAMELTNFLVKNQNEGQKIIVIQISSDPDLLAGFDKATVDPAEEDCRPGEFKTPLKKSSDKKTASALSEIGGPVSAIMKTRESRGMLAAKRLKCISQTAENISYFHFRMKTPVNQPNLKAPLGWTLSDRLAKSISNQLEKDAETLENVCEVLKLLKPASNGMNCTQSSNADWK